MPRRAFVLMFLLPLVTAVAPALGSAAEPEVHHIVLADPPLALYGGGIAGLAPTDPSVTGQRRLDPDSPASFAYLEYLSAQHDAFISELETRLGRSVEVLFEYRAALNGMTVLLRPLEVSIVEGIPQVSRVAPDFERFILTDRGPPWIGAPAIWDASATGGLPGTKGEQILVGVIDTGINHDHPSFADPGPVDGFDHTNPRGTFLGECAADPSPCNDKLIGVYDFTSTSFEDTNGHGSHTASTAAGNFVEAPFSAPDGGTTTRTISGVAPHANLVTYKTCPDISCPLAFLLAAIDQATLDVVDVINYSIGGGSNNPWTDPDAQAFLAARNAGIFVATSAGNDGPGDSTVGSPADAPWVTAVGATTQDRGFRTGLVDMSGGATAPPADIIGASTTESYGPELIVYAGDFGDPLCAVPFPPGTFDGEIVVCDRGETARVSKALVVAAAGAGGFVLANTEAETWNLPQDDYPIPGVNIAHEDSVVLKDWLGDGGTGHTATIQESSVGSVPPLGDIMGSFSSRGPDPSVPDVIKPDVAAPGVRIRAATETPSEYGTISGTSMASPHTAGAGALLRALHPDWTPDEVKSALMTTAFNTLPGTGLERHGVLEEVDLTPLDPQDPDALLPTDPFDVGGGRIDLRQVARAGLVLNETAANYDSADPALGGNASALNIASFGQDACPGTCSWTRTVRSSAAGTVTWETAFEGPGDMGFNVSPSTFTLAPGAEQTLTLTVDVSSLPNGEWNFARLRLFPSDPSIPESHLPVAVKPVTGQGEGGEPVPLALYFHGNLHDGCTGSGPADVTLCNGPHLFEDSELDPVAPSAKFPATAGFSGGARNEIDPNWAWRPDEPTTVAGPMTVEWWASCSLCADFLAADWRIRLFADGTEVLEQRVTAAPPLPDIPALVSATVLVPEATASEFVLHVDPVFMDIQQGSVVYYDSVAPCSALNNGPCDSRVTMPVTSNLPPKAVDDFAQVPNDSSVAIDVLANDSDPNHTTSELTVTIEPGGPSNGSAVVEADNTVIYTHDGSGAISDSFVYRVADPTGASDTATVSIEILGCNTSFFDNVDPAAHPGWRVETAANDNPASIPWTVLPDAFAHSLPNSWFSDATTLDLKDNRLISPPLNISSNSRLIFWHRFFFEPEFDGGVLEVSTDGGASWQDIVAAGGVFVEGAYNGEIDPDFDSPIAGRDAWTGFSEFVDATNRVEVDLSALAGPQRLFRWRLATDPIAIGAIPGEGWWLDDVEVTLTCLDPNNPPVARDDIASVPPGESVNIEVLANDSDPEGDPLKVKIVSGPSDGTAVVEPDNSVTYTHDGSTTTSDSFVYRITDPGGLFDEATVLVTITENNDPVAKDDRVKVKRGESVTFDVFRNDRDRDRDSISMSSFTQPSHGTVVHQGGGEFTYTHDGGESNSDSFTYTISDGKGGFDTATVVIRVIRRGGPR